MTCTVQLTEGAGAAPSVRQFRGVYALNTEGRVFYDVARTNYEGLREAVAALPAAQLGWKPAAQASSVAEILNHLSAWEGFLLAAAQRGEARAQTAVGPVTPGPALSKLDALHERFLGFIEGLSPDALDTKRNVAGREVTVRELVLRWLRHEHYHVGQINYIHFLLGLQPEQTALPPVPVEGGK